MTTIKYLNEIRPIHGNSRSGILPLVLMSAVTLRGLAGDLCVTVDGIDSARGGEVGIALFASGAGYPMDGSKATKTWHKAGASSLTHCFKGLAAGTYAIAVSQDFNGNRLTDTTVFGIPKEPWGVSNNIRPKLRAPRFSECSFTITNSAPQTLSIHIKI
jgi:uncharacterized protein (DUF2141 family)